MKAYVHDGLVRAVIKQPFRGYREGDTVRLSPVEAQRYADHIEEAKAPKGLKAETVKEPEPEPVKILPNPVPAVPEDWEDQHVLQRRKLAEQIIKRPVRTDEADAIIKAELARRLTE